MQAAKVKLDLEERNGELVPVEGLGEQIDRLLLGVRSHFLALPSKAAPTVFVCKSVGTTAEELQKYVHESLSELADMPVEEVMKRAANE